MPRGLDGTYCRMGRGNRRKVVERNKHHPLDAATTAAEGGMSMGVYIKGMEMPTLCEDCKAFVCYKQWASDIGD